MDEITLPQAATSNNVTGALQQLLLSRAKTPEQAQQAQQQRRQSLAEYQDELRAPPMGGYTGTEHSLYNWIGNIPNNTPANALYKGIAAGGDWVKNNATGLQSGRTAAAKVGYEDAKSEDASFDNDRLLASMGRQGIAKPPSPEALRTVYNGARNEYAQQAKQYNFGSPAEREQWIEQGANRAVQNYLQNFATQPTGPRGVQEPEAQQSLAPEMPQQQGIGATLAVPPGADEAAIIAQLQGATRAAQSPETSIKGMQQLQALRQQFPQRQQTAEMPGGGLNGIFSTNVQQPTNQPSQPTMRMGSQQAAQSVIPVPRNLPQEAGAKAGATGMAESYVKDYETVQQAAMSAEAQKQAFDNLAKIRPETNALANTQQTIGALFSALGQDPNSPTIQNAIKTRDANLIISQLTNAGLRAEKGVQTKSDEVRVANEFPKTTDFQQVWNFSIKLGQERAQRTLEQRDFFDSVAAANNGSPTRARQLWNREMANDPLTQYLGNKLIFRNDFIKAYEAKHPELGPQAAVQVWREMEQDYQKRGGRK